MKVIHIIKRIEDLDQDVRELKKLEKSIKKNKSFTTPIYMSIEKQINLLLGERIKLLELKIENPPEALKKEIEGEVEAAAPLKKSPPEAEKKRKESRPRQSVDEAPDDDELIMLTQDQIDAKINNLEAEKKRSKPTSPARAALGQKTKDDEGVKILDIALERGTLADVEDKQEQEKEKKVKFFRDNFPVE